MNRMVLYLLLVLMFSCNITRNNNANTSQIEKKSTHIAFSIPVHPLQNNQDLDILIKEIGDARIVLLGEASHGTSEYYTWRAAITKRLIEEKGFDFIAVEGDWSEANRINNLIHEEKKDSSAIVHLLQLYYRWPTWLWSNYEMIPLISWLNAYNQNMSAGHKIGFYGLDLFSIWESVSELIYHLGDTSILKIARKFQDCFQSYRDNEIQYAVAISKGERGCSDEANDLWRSMLHLTHGQQGRNEFQFLIEQNSLVAFNGEKYFRTMLSNRVQSWNIRDQHMTETIKRLLRFHGPHSKAIIWEHNTHVGDAHYTDMSRAGKTNTGELLRKEYGPSHVFIVGFGSFQGSVIAAEKWGNPYQKMQVPAAVAGSWEEILHEQGAFNKIIFSREIIRNRNLNGWINQRAIGVVYQPKREKLGNYMPSIIPQRYDAFLFIDQTNALHPIDSPVRSALTQSDTTHWDY